MLSEIVHFGLDSTRRVQIRHDLQHERLYRVVFGLLIQHENPENHMPYSLFDCQHNKHKMNTINTYDNTPDNTMNTDNINKHLCFENSLGNLRN